MDIPVVELTELEKLEVTRVDAVGRPANGFPVLLMKGLAEPELVKDWSDWDAAHEGGGKGKPSAAGDSKASAADAVARAKQTIADHKAGKKVSAADLKNAHEVHEAHLAHEAKLKADAEAKGKGKPAAKPAAKPKAKNPKAAKELAKMIIAAPHADPLLLLKAVSDDGEVDEEPDIDGGTKVLAMIADLIIAEAEELKAGQAGEICDILELACAAEKIWCWRTGEQAVSSGSVMPATALMQSTREDYEKHVDSLLVPVRGEMDRIRAELAKDRDYSDGERKEMAADGRALPDGCVSGETLVATKQGPRRIDSLVGECELLTDKGWECGEVRSFGVKPLLAVTLRKDGELATVFATTGHRWLTANGTWKLTGALTAGDGIPHVEIAEEGPGADHLKSTDHGVTADAQQAAHGSGLMGVVNVQAGPRSAGAGVSAALARDAFTDGALTALLGGEGFELGLGDAVLAAKHAIAPGHPPFVGDLDALSTDPGAFRHAEAAVGPAALAPDVEVGVRAFGATGPAGHGTLVLDRHPDRLLAGSLGAKLGEPVGEVMRAAESLGVVGLSAVRNGAYLHTENLTRSATWTVENVTETPRAEEVFCAVVPDLHRFALANGILTGNSYPIADEHDLNSAAILARSGHGDVTAATRHIGKRAKDLGVKNPLDDTGDTSKSQIAEGGTDVDTETQTGDLTEVVKAAVAKANAPLVKEIADLKAARDLDRAELAKVKATPVPGGLVLSHNVQTKQSGGVVNEDKAVKAALMRQKAADATDPGDRAGLIAYARELDEEARKAAPSA